MDNRPIGVFDSGLGGLTVVRELEKILPGEDLVYFGDTGRVPYGTKGRDTIKKFAQQDVRFLHSFDVKAIIIACGTVSSVAFEEAKREAGVPIFGVVEPAAQAAVRATKSGKIVVLGTSATIRSGSYEKAIIKKLENAQLRAKACPLLVPLVENGHIDKDDRVVQLVAHGYLDALLPFGADTAILGCTHYPLLQDTFAQVMGKDVTLIDPGRETALAAAQHLRESGLLSEQSSGGNRRYYVSDFCEDFTRLAGILLNHPLSGYVEKTDIEKY